MTRQNQARRTRPRVRRPPLIPILVLAAATMALMASASTAAAEKTQPTAACGTHEIVVGEARPLLTVVAPPTAESVRAYLPWGKQAELKYDAERQQWSARVPYLAIHSDWKQFTWIRTKLRNGEVQWHRTNNVGQSPSPLFLARTPKTVETGRAVDLEVDPLVPMRAVLVDLPWLNRGPVKLHAEEATGRFEGELTLPADVPHEKVAVRVTLVRPSGKHVSGWFSLPVALGLRSCRAS